MAQETFKLSKLLGCGSFGIVFETLPEAGERQFAVKYVFPPKEDDERIKREYNLVSRIDHVNIVKTYNITEKLKYTEKELQTLVPEGLELSGNAQGLLARYSHLARAEGSVNLYIITMELCGNTLRHWLKCESIEDLLYKRVKIVEESIAGVQYLHSKNIIHRDLKPENILFSNHPSNHPYSLPIKIGDFGLCREASNTATSTLSSNVGSALYAAPEVKMGSYGFQSDLFSLGLLMWEVLQRIPFSKVGMYFDRLVNDGDDSLIQDYLPIANGKMLIVSLTKRKKRERIQTIEDVIIQVNTEGLLDLDFMENFSDNASHEKTPPLSENVGDLNIDKESFFSETVKKESLERENVQTKSLKQKVALETQSSLPNQNQKNTPVKIIDFKLGKGLPSQLSLNKEKLQEILLPLENIPIHLLSIAGPSRQGKSFFLSALVHLLKKFEERGQKGHFYFGDGEIMQAFPFRNGIDRQTIGFWLWPHPFIFTRSDGSKIALLLMDTQGIFDQFTTKRDWSIILSLTLLTSSCVIYNQMGLLQENTLEIFNNFAKFGRMAMLESISPSFQDLVFLIRDWNVPDAYPYGWEGGSQFIERTLTPRPEIPEELRNVRENFATYFKDIRCFLMPPPGEKAKYNNFKGDLSTLDTHFLKSVEQFVEEWIQPDRMKEKCIASKSVDGPQLFSIFEKYVKTFNETTFPIGKSLYELMTADILVDRAKEIFEDEVALVLDKKDSLFLKNYKQSCNLNPESFVNATKSLKLKPRNNSTLFRMFQGLVLWPQRRDPRIAAIARHGATFYKEEMQKQLHKTALHPNKFKQYSQAAKENAVSRIRQTFNCELVSDKAWIEFESNISPLEMAFYQENERHLLIRQQNCETAMQMAVDVYQHYLKIISVMNEISLEKFTSIHHLAVKEATEMFHQGLSLENGEVREKSQCRISSGITNVFETVIKGVKQGTDSFMTSNMENEVRKCPKNLGVNMTKSRTHPYIIPKKCEKVVPGEQKVEEKRKNIISLD